MDDREIVKEEWFKCGNPLANSKIKDLPWPYNLVACIKPEYTGTAQPIDYQLSPAHIQYIEEVTFSHLTTRKSSCIFGFFRDGLTSDQIGEQLGVTRSRIAYNIHEALRDLHRPSVREKILYGPEVASRQDAIKQRLAALDDQERELDYRAEVLNRREETLREQEEALAARIEALKEQLAEHGLEPTAPLPDTIERPYIYDVTIEEMDLSTRAYNCLHRTGHETLGDVMETARQGGLCRIRNLGRHTLWEILAKIQTLTGESLTGEYKL